MDKWHEGQMFVSKSVVLTQHIFAAWGTFDSILRLFWLPQKKGDTPVTLWVTARNDAEHTTVIQQSYTKEKYLTQNVTSDNVEKLT